MEHDLIIVGGGPVGLALAAALAPLGRSIAVVERQPRAALADPAEDGRYIALTHRSIGFLQQVGAWDRIDPADRSPLREAQVLNGQSPFALSFDPGSGGAQWLGQLVSNHLIRRALFDTVAAYGNVTLLADVAVQDVATDRRAARVTLADGRVLTGQLLAGADSRFSKVREALGIGAEVKRLGRSMLLARVAHEGDHGGIATEWFQHGHTIAMLPLNGRRSSAVLTLEDSDVVRVAAMSPAELGAEITRRYGHRLGAMQVEAGPHVYPLAVTYAAHFAARRAALLGDAAVGMNPVTAHGFNLGLQGVASLAGLIGGAGAGADWGGTLLLRRFEGAHRLATRPIYAATNLLVGLYGDDSLPARVMRHATLRAGAHLPLARRAVARMLMQP
ncbi:5-demethoxyubiquinol-8 5-hydroxylase UbiM [Croceibacterium ferulae]|uniref:5-demethoxyubiquinol-8 5-hydroxylase UbiM n=1 Tax=Croceibacterium ferulae TaxID=1854641 RepID=UPI000EAC8BE5|nr:5-demethoxyubiquinol-8 5-hydroxylase UbiM [Croceibacterium ferulae]